jgi:hypothetical protein
MFIEDSRLILSSCDSFWYTARQVRNVVVTSISISKSWTSQDLRNYCKASHLAAPRSTGYS